MRSLCPILILCNMHILRSTLKSALSPDSNTQFKAIAYKDAKPGFRYSGLRRPLSYDDFEFIEESYEDEKEVGTKHKSEGISETLRKQLNEEPKNLLNYFLNLDF